MTDQVKAPPVPTRAPTTPTTQRPIQQQGIPTGVHPAVSQQGVRTTQNPQQPVRTNVQQPARTAQQSTTQSGQTQSGQTQMRSAPQQQVGRIQQPQAQAQGNRPAGQQSVQSSANEQSYNSSGKYDNNFAADFNLPPSILSSKTIGILMMIVCVFGLVMGSVLFGGNSTPQAVGLQGVIQNQDITTKLPRCGRTDPGQACVLYIMNHTRYDKIAENFFDDAVRLTEVQKYSIAMVNPKYAKTRIPPGYFAEIKIPNVR